MVLADNIDESHLKNNILKIDVTDTEYIFYDFSKTDITKQETNDILATLNEKKLDSKIDQMKQGENINYTEKRPVLHHLLRSKEVLDNVDRRLKVGEKQSNENGVKKPKKNYLEMAKLEIEEELIKICEFSSNFSKMKGVTNQNFDTIVNIGIGGSDLGPKMVTDALQYYSKHKAYFISNIDPTDAIKVFKEIDINKTLFIVVSKTFTTVETIENFKLCLKMAESLFMNKYSENEICNKHFVAVSSNIEEAEKYGISTIFKMWDFVGGRYSLWSAVGLSIALSLGFDNFFRMLRGASIADDEFFGSKMSSISVKMAVNEIFYIKKGYNNKCLVCYDSYLTLLYKYLQQAEMESNGKHGSKQMIIWGGVGTDVQHSFFQLLHQGEQDIYLELLLPLKNINVEATRREIPDPSNLDLAIIACKDIIENNQRLLSANCLAQSRSLLIGKDSDDQNLFFKGGKPSVTIAYTRLTPEVLGSILSIYENKIFVEGIYFSINSFDQFGVQLGKKIANELLADGGDENLDLSTAFMLSLLKK